MALSTLFHFLLVVGDGTVCVLERNQTELAHSFWSVRVSVSVFMALSTLFHSINSADNCTLSDSVLRVFDTEGTNSSKILCPMFVYLLFYVNLCHD